MNKDKNQRAFVRGFSSDSGEEDDEKVNNETCLVAQASSEVCSESSYFSDENSSIDDLILENEYDKLCKMSLKIITKNKRLKATRDSLEKEISILKEKVSTLEKNKEVDLECVKCHMLKIENEKLKEEALKLTNYKAYNGGNVIFGSNLRGNIIGKGTISKDSLKIDNVERVDNLRFNLLSRGQIYDNKCRVTFSEHDSEITKDDKVIGRGIRKKDLYVMKLGNKTKDKICLATIDENSTLWHRRLGHANMHLIQSLSSKELVRNLPKLKFDQHFYDACKKRKQAHASHKAKNIVSTTRCLELLHMDLCGLSAVRSYRGNHYTLVIVDDYSRYTWTRFLKDKTKAFDQFEIFSKKIQNQLGCTIVSIRTDLGREFGNEVQFGEFCNANGITHNFSAPRTPQSNGVVERKNRTLQEMSRTMLNEQSLPQKFWCNTIDTSTYILNRILIRAILGKTPYELLRGRKPTLDYFRVLGNKCFILNTKDYLTKFDPKSYEGIFLGYSQNSKAYIILNKHTRKVEESLNMTFDETPPPSKTSPLVDDDLDEEEAIKVTEKKNLENDIVDETLEIDEIVNIKESRNHPLENVIGNLNQRTLRSQSQNQSNFFCFISTIEPKNVNEALTDNSWIVAMQEKLKQFIANDVWELVPQPRNMIIIGTKWVFRNKLDENGIVSRNKCRLVPQGYNQQEGIDYDETYSPVARLESIRILLAYACPKACSTCQDMCDEFVKIMHDQFKMSMMGELNFFLGLQIKQMEDGIYFNQSKYIKEMLKKFGLEESKPMKTPMSSDTKLKKDEECESVNSTKYRGMIVCLIVLPLEKTTISTTEAEYISAGKACQQALWMKQALIDYDVQLNDVSIMCDNKGAIDLRKNPVQHSRTEHIKICHHFLRDIVQKGHTSIKKVPSVDNISDILTKPLKCELSNYLRLGLGMMEHIPLSC
ncbi:retrovirus-related pol polyprotein from transposon TNT 1-94 [Tanacetum coccineum]